MPDWKPRTGQTIDALYAWICTEPDGGEGVISFQVGNFHYPAVGADMERVRSIRPIAEDVHAKTGYPVRLVRFGSREDLEILP